MRPMDPEGAMPRPDDPRSVERSLQKFLSIHAAVHNHFNKDRHLNSRNPFKASRTAVLTAWQHAGEPLELGSAQGTFSNHGRVTHGQSPWAAHLPAVRGGVPWRQSVKAKTHHRK